MKHGISKTSSQFSETVHPTSNLNSMDLTSTHGKSIPLFTSLFSGNNSTSSIE
jgi:hypothetical protein